MLNPDPYIHTPEEDEAFERMSQEQQEHERAEWLGNRAHQMNVSICRALLGETWEDC